MMKETEGIVTGLAKRRVVSGRGGVVVRCESVKQHTNI
jgi:hypothetical protein